MDSQSNLSSKPGKVFAIADLHLSFGVPNKRMDVFGERWKDHAEKIEVQWRRLIHKDDLVLIAGDISWAMRIDEVKPDFEWIEALPGTKVMIRGNHDYWWESLKKITAILPPSCHLIQNNCFMWNGIAIGGTRLWDVPDLNFSDYIDFKPSASTAKEIPETVLSDQLKIYQRELIRLETSLQQMPKEALKKIVMTHYPPVGAQLEKTAVSDLLEKYGVDICIFGHLHNLKQNQPLFGKLNGVSYFLTACDYLENFRPIQLL